MRCIVALLLALLAAPAVADAPLPAPARTTTCSRSGDVCAVSDPVADETIVSSRTPSARSWSIPGWHRWLFVSDDGHSVVVGHPGMNLLPLDVTLAEPVLSFYRDATLVRTVRLGDLYERMSQLKRTVSHLAWVETVGFDAANRLVIELVTGEKVAFDVDTRRVRALEPGGTPTRLRPLAESPAPELRLWHEVALVEDGVEGVVVTPGVVSFYAGAIRESAERVSSTTTPHGDDILRQLGTLRAHDGKWLACRRIKDAWSLDVEGRDAAGGFAFTAHVPNLCTEGPAKDVFDLYAGLLALREPEGE